MQIRRQAFRYQRIPSREQHRKMRQLPAARAMCSTGRWRSRTSRKQSGHAALCKLLTAWRNDPETAWLGGCPVHAAQQALGNLEAGWSRHFESRRKLKRREISREELVQAPRLKEKQQAREGFRYPDKQFPIEERFNRRVFLPKPGWVRYSPKRDPDRDSRRSRPLFGPQ